MSITKCAGCRVEVDTDDAYEVAGEPGLHCRECARDLTGEEPGA